MVLKFSLFLLTIIIFMHDVEKVVANSCESHSDGVIVQYQDSGSTCTVLSSDSCIGNLHFSVNDILPLHLFGGQKTVHIAPKIKFCHAHPDAFYTVMMVDPDAPSPQSPTAAPWLHWLVVNIYGENLISGESEGDTVKEYAPPSPPSGIHRYVFLLYPQSRRLNSVEPIEARARFDMDGFKKEYGLLDRVEVGGFRTGSSKPDDM